MKKIFLTLCVAFASIAMYAAGLENVRIYVNPGHGSWGANDRPMATIPYPELPTTGMPDTIGFYESNTNLWKCQELVKKLREAGAFVLESRTQNGPWPYQMVDGDYPDYSWEAYQKVDGFAKYNRSPTEIAAEVEANNIDYFISVHSNAIDPDGNLTNYLYLISGREDYSGSAVAACKERAVKAWPYIFDAMGKGFEYSSHWSYTNMKVQPQNSLGVLRHSVPGFLSEGFFHTYQPARHRALNKDYCREEGLRYYRGIAAWYGLEGAAADDKGYILGAVKDKHTKMNHPLYTYAPKSHDQYVPLHNAVVTLYKGGVKVADYTTDTCVNGVFFFRDLEPGADYTIDITHPGYEPLEAEYKTPITVEANTTTYPVVFMVDTGYIPPKVVYTDYPNVAPNQMLGSVYNFEEKGDTTYAIEGVIKRTIAVGDSTIVLSHTDKSPHLYLINHLTGEISPITTEGLLPIDTENVGEHYELSDVALTCDGKLIGINEIICQFDAGQIKDGEKRGELQLYKWESLSAETVQPWFTVSGRAETSGNFYRAVTGQTLTVSGESEECTITTTARTASGTAIRIVQIAVADNKLASAGRYNPVGTGTNLQGVNYLLQLSPRNTENNIILDGELSGAVELAKSGTISTADSALVGDLPSQPNFINYNGKALMVSPYTTDEGTIAGVKLIDVTNGLDKAKVVKANLDLETPVAAKFASASTKVIGADLRVYLVTDSTVTTFTTVGVEQPVFKGVYAYNLGLSRQDSIYTFSFTANDAVLHADLVLYSDSAEEKRYAIENVLAGKNEIQVKVSELPGAEGDIFTWAVELEGENISRWDVLYTETAVTYARAFNTVDNSPESDYFGRIYVMDRVGAENTKNGVYVYDQEWRLQNTTNYAGGQAFWRNPTRPTVDSKGTVYFADWGDNHSGVYVADPAHILDGTYTQLFAGTRDDNGVFTNNGAAVGSSTPGVHIYGTGKDTKLYVYNEDASGTLPANGVVVYNLGQEDGTIASTWETAPSAIYTLTGQGNTEGNVWATSHGFFVSQNRSAGNNNTGYTSLKFYDNAGNQQFSSAENGFEDIIDGSAGGGYVVTPDESRLILNDGSKNFLVFDIAWEGDVPTLTLVATHNHGMADIRQMNLDYAGNLIASGLGSGFQIFSVPTDENIHLTPAKKSLIVKKEVVSAVTSVILSATRDTLEVGEVLTLTATIAPEDATTPTITWTSSDDAIATVEDGVVTAIAEGSATITVSVINEAMTEALTAICEVVVKVVDGLLTIETSGIYYSMETIHNPQGLYLQVFNLNGQLVTTGNTDINMSSAANGLYIVRCNAGVVKFIK